MKGNMLCMLACSNSRNLNEPVFVALSGLGLLRFAF